MWPLFPAAPNAQLEMRDHEADALAAVRGFAEGDLSAIQRAGSRLARPDSTQGIPVTALPLLHSVRRIGGLLAGSSDSGQVATQLASLAGTCGSCHALTGVTPTAAATGSSLERAFLAVALRDEKLWMAFRANAPQPHDAGSWPLRERVLRQVLREADSH